MSDAGSGNEMFGTPQRAARPAASPASSRQVESPMLARTPDSVARGAGGSDFESPAGGSATGSDLRTPQRRVQVQSSPHSGSQGERSSHRARRGFLASTPGPQGAQRDGSKVLYGSTIDEEFVAEEVMKFVHNFRLEGTPASEPAHYLKELRRQWEQCTEPKKGIVFTINAQHLNQFSSRLYESFVQCPLEAIPIVDQALWSASLQELQSEPEDLGRVQVQLHSLLEKDQRQMRDINVREIERLISVQGIVIRMTDPMPDVSTAAFRCFNMTCRNWEYVPLDQGTIKEPMRCEQCLKTHTYQLMHNDGTYTDKQVIKLQEPPELVPHGETPQNIQVMVFDDLVDSVRPGDRIEVVGVFKAAPFRPDRKFTECNTVYRTYVDAVSLAADLSNRLAAEVDTNDDAGPPPKLEEKADLDPARHTDEEIAWHKKIRELAANKDDNGQPTIVEKLVQSIAPSIFEEEEVKKGLLCHLFGGTPKNVVSGSGDKRCRPEINTLLCGDPSTAKSQFLSYVYKLAPRGIYTSGKGSTAVGLTASINKDPATGDLVLQSGALVLADRGVCCIDEFDKMEESARAILHEVMESQTISVAKAGVLSQLHARCSILASANPKGSSYNPKMSVAENINLGKNLMSRFDFIWLMLDKRDAKQDARLVRHLASMYSVHGVAKRAEPALENELFRRYVSFARKWVYPRINEEASAALVEAYKDLRNQGTSRETITATTRILESLIRISESLAKMELREEVTVTDVNEALRLLKSATYAAVVDPTTGKIDFEQLVAGMGASKRQRKHDVEQLFQDTLAELASDGKTISIEHLKDAMNAKLSEKKEAPVNEAEFSAALRVGEHDGWCRKSGVELEYR